jgi:hypothetical protein
MIQIHQKYHDKILIELAGHDHLSDVRYHEGFTVNASNPDYSTFILGDPLDKTEYLHRVLIAPGTTSIYF